MKKFLFNLALASLLCGMVALIAYSAELGPWICMGIIYAVVVLLLAAYLIVEHYSDEL